MLKRHMATAITLVVFSAGVQSAVISRAVVPAQDAVRYVIAAQSIDRRAVAPVGPVGSEALFPAWVCGVHHTIVAVRGDGPTRWAEAVQIAAAVPLILAVVPVYAFILVAAGSQAAVVGGVFFCMLPEVSRLGADGLADSMHLSFCCMALWPISLFLTARATPPIENAPKVPTDRPARDTTGHPLWLALAGLFIGLAWLVRSEVAVLAVALMLLLVLLPMARRLRIEPRTAAAGAMFFLCGAAVGPLAQAVVFTPGTVPEASLGNGQGTQAGHVAAGRFLSEASTAGMSRRITELSDGGSPFVFPVKENTVTSRRRGPVAAGKEYLRELPRAFHYWIGGLAVVGGAVGFRRGWQRMDLLVLTTFVLLSGVAIGVAARVGYLSTRHFLLLVPLVMLWAASGTISVAEVCRRRRIVGESALWRKLANWAPLTLAVAAAVACAPRTFGQWHAGRRAHRQAAAWLARPTAVTGAVLDPRGWTGLYSGKRTYRYDAADAGFADPHLAYVVIERRELSFRSQRSRSLRRLLEIAAHREAIFGPPRRPERQVEVYRWHPDWLANYVESGMGGFGTRHSEAFTR